jgi:DNA mismatch endonuclease (patch repair protein)
MRARCVARRPCRRSYKASKAPSYNGLRPASRRASSAARKSSRKAGTRCEEILHSTLHQLGLKFSMNVADLSGRPDVVFRRERLVVFRDGDFWHGRHLRRRLRKLGKGHNAQYWVAKLRSTVDRDRRNVSALHAGGWRVLRFWEGDIVRAPDAVAARVAEGGRAESRLEQQVGVGPSSRRAIGQRSSHSSGVRPKHENAARR